MQNHRNIQTDNTFHWFLLSTLVLIALLSSSFLLFSNAQAEEQSNSTTQTVTQTKTPNQVSSEDSTSKNLIEPEKQSTIIVDASSQRKKSVLSEAEQWQKRVTELIEKIKKGDKSSKDAEALYHELSNALQKQRLKLGKALKWAHSPYDLVPQEAQPEITKRGEKTSRFESQSKTGTVADLYTTMVSLYITRDQLLKVVTPELKAQVTGRGTVGISKLKGEMEFMVLHLRFHAMAIPKIGPQLMIQFKADPALVISNILLILFSILVFRWWRKWAPEGLVKLRGLILDTKPRTYFSLRIARLVWYLEQIRHPLEWIVLTSIFFDAIYVPSLEVIENFCRIIILWILFAWLAVVLIHTMASRGVAGLSGNRAKLRLRSLRLLATWLVLLGLGLELAKTYTGQGAIYANVWLVFKILSVPVFLLLLAWWRSEIFENLERLPFIPEWVEKALLNKKGLHSYSNALLGGVYLLVLEIRQLSLRQLAKLEVGREFLAGLLEREVAQEVERQNQTIVGKPISEKSKEILLASDGKILEKVFSKDLKQITERVELMRGGLIGVIGERGSGKSILLQRLASSFQDKSITIQCSMGGFDDIKKELAYKFGLTKGQVRSENLSELINSRELSFIAVDDAHRLVRPKMGGQLEMNRLSEFAQQIKSNITWILAMDRPAYQYVKRVRADHSIVEDLVELPTWTQEQISELIEYRCKQAGITPDFNQIEIPHQFDETDFESLEERNRSGFYRILWNTSGGNPSVALRLWADALTVMKDNHIVVQRLPSELEIDTEQLENADLPLLLLLRVIAQSEMSTIDDISESLQLPFVVVSNAIRVALIRGWVEQIDDYYRITWRWFRSINRVLARQNFLTR